ncbi:hypothetical protein FQA39_LY14270 [Lamprigera yunnana]|nr:hypothetical protein FQA39_LY14270 [Lamprigera yunnana]
MSTLDDLSTSSSSFDRSDCSNVIYNNQHFVDVFYPNRQCMQKSVLIVIMTQASAFKMKVRDACQYSFNYTTVIDWMKFDIMRKEQSLDITFNEFQPQIIDLLNQTLNKHMQMRLEVGDGTCKVVFYEKSRLKSLIFLTVDLGLTNHKDVIDELSDNVSQLKNYNNALNSQLSVTKSQLFETESKLKISVSKSSILEKQFYKDLELIFQTFLSRIRNTETNISISLSKLTKRHQKLLVDLDLLKKDAYLKNESTARLLQSVQNLRLENERHQRIIVEIKSENENLKISNSNVEDSMKELKLGLSTKESTVELLQKQLDELRQDIQDATLIIAQKTKTNDEIGKDLLEANRLLVNFNSQYDMICGEVEDLKERIVCKDEVIKEQVAQIERLNNEYKNYCGMYNSEGMTDLKVELRHAKQRIEELEKQNKDAIKLNGLLTKKLSNGENYEPRNVNIAYSNRS